MVCTGRQLWDEQYEQGSYDEGEKVSTSNLRCKNPILVIPNRTLALYTGTAAGFRVQEYDANHTFIKHTSNPTNNRITLTAQTRYITFFMAGGYGTTYHNDITISLYYSPEQGGEGYDQYYDYVEPNVYDTGTEVLRQAGSVKDTKLPDGTITHNISTTGYTFTGQETWTQNNHCYQTQTGLVPLAKIYNSSILGNVSHSKLVRQKASDLYDGTFSSGIAIDQNGKITIGENDYANISNLTGTTLYYELATPTTEQGTSFPENIGVNDYGMMYWLDTDGNLVSIPQGCKLFYPVDYVLYLDTLVSHTEGDATSLVRWSDMATQSEIDEILDLI